MNNLFHSKRFWLGLVLRLICLPFLGSHYLRDLFIPFLDAAIASPFSNPWNNFPPEYFPYGSVLYFILFIPRYLGHLFFGSIALGATPLGIASVKLPLLILDIFTLITLMKLTPRRQYQVYLYYWLNPILFFITYIFGQLDLAVMAFTIFSLFFIVRGRYVLSALTFAAAILCKFHVILIVPLIFAYIWGRYFVSEATRRIGIWSGILITISAIGFLPLILAKKFAYAATSSPQAKQLLAWQIPIGDSVTLYIGAAVVIAVLCRLVISSRISEEGLIFGSGTVMGVLLLVTQSAHGWYFWVLPFLALFYANYITAPRILYWTMTALYFVHFVVFADKSLPPDSMNGIASGLAFTLLEVVLAAILLFMWIQVVRRQAPLGKFGRPRVIGIAGDSGAGKNTLSQTLCDLFESAKTLVIEGDDYHKWERGNTKWQDYTHLNPKANFLSQMANHTQDLLTGKLVFQPHYNHQTGEFSSPQEMRPNRTIIVQGLHTLYLRNMRDTLDLKVFLCPDEIIRLAWKLKRDVKERGHSVEKIIETLKKRMQDSKSHILPQQELADWVIAFYPTEDITENEVIEGKMPRIGIRNTLWNDAPVSDLLTRLSTTGCVNIHFDSNPDDISRIVINIEGNPDAQTIEDVAKDCFPILRELTRSSRPPKFHAGIDGILQLLALALLRANENSNG